MSFYYEGMRRMDWGFGNPNHAAAFIGMLMMLSLALAFLRNRGGFWMGLVIFAALGVCLVLTFSRGGLVAASLGSAALLVFAPRPWRISRVCAVLVVAGILGACAITATATQRYASAWQGDPSVANRLDLWKHVPRMILDAPGGWGLGRSQIAYMQWYQGVDRDERFLNLVSLHGTLLAELNWPLRVCYLALIILGFVLTFPRKSCPLLTIPFSMWTVFCVAGIFTHFGRSWPVHLLALLALLTAGFLRWRHRTWPPAFAWASGFGLALVAAAALAVGGRFEDSVVRHGERNLVMIGRGEGKPSVWMVGSTKILGSGYGKTLRRRIAGDSRFPTFGFVLRAADLPAEAERVIFCGDLDADSAAALQRRKLKSLLLLNPTALPGQFPDVPSVSAVFGEFAHSNAFPLWRQAGKATIIPGVGDYLPDWPQLLTGNPPKQ